MANDEIVDRIRRRRAGEVTKAKVGGHKVLIDKARPPGGEVTTLHRIKKGRVTQLVAANGSYREDVAAALLEVPPGEPDRVRPVPLDVPGFPLDRAVLLPTEDHDTVLVAPVHRCEVLEGEKPDAFRYTTTGRGIGLRLNDWGRTPAPRADARLLDDWPGGSIRPSKRHYPWPAERLLGRIAAEGPSGVRLEVRDMRGYVVVLRREWDRIVGTLTAPGGGAERSVDVPRYELWPALAPLFHGDDPATLVLEAPSPPEPGLLEMRYETVDRGWAQLPTLATVADCVARIENHILRTPGNWAVFTSRSDAVVQVECAEDGRLWLETPLPDLKKSQGAHVSVAEAARLLKILAHEDRSAVHELDGAETVDW